MKTITIILHVLEYFINRFKSILIIDAHALKIDWEGVMWDVCPKILGRESMMLQKNSKGYTLFVFQLIYIKTFLKIFPD